MTKLSVGESLALRRARMRLVVFMTASLMIASVTGSSAGSPTITQIGLGESVTITADAECVSAVAKSGRTEADWRLFDASGEVRSNNFRASGTTFKGVAPGFYVIKAVVFNISQASQTSVLTLENECGLTPLVVSNGAGLLVSTGPVNAKKGNTLMVGQLFAKGQALVANNFLLVSVTLTGGLSFSPDNSATFASGGNPLALDAALVRPISVRGSGAAIIRVVAQFPSGATLDDQYLTAVNAPDPTPPPPTPPAPTPAPTVVPAPVPPGATPAPVSPGPTPQAPSPPPPAPEPPSGSTQTPTAVAASVVAKKNTATPVVLKGAGPPGKPLRYSVVDFPENGRITGRAPNLTYKPDNGFVGTDAFTFTVSDGATTSEPAIVTVTVTSAKAKAIVRRKATTKRK